MGFIVKSDEIKAGDKKIVYEAYKKNGKYKGIIVDIIHLEENMSSSQYLSLNPSLYVHDIASNVDPCATLHPIGESDDFLMSPCEPYAVDNSIATLELERMFKGNYLGNIIFNEFNESNCKKTACFVSQESKGMKIYRYYKFLDLTDTDILAGTEYDLDSEYGFGYLFEDSSTQQNEHEEFTRRLVEMSSTINFTVLLDENGDELLIDYNGEGVTEDGIRRFEIFQRNILDILKQGYELLQIPYKTTKSRNKSNKLRAKELKGKFRIASENEVDKSSSGSEQK